MQHCNRQLFPVNKRSNYYSTIVYVFNRHPDNDYDSLRPLLTVAAWEWPAPRSLRRSFVERSCCACAAIPVGWTLVSCALKADVATAAARRGTCASPQRGSGRGLQRGGRRSGCWSRCRSCQRIVVTRLGAIGRGFVL